MNLHAALRPNQGGFITLDDASAILGLTEGSVARLCRQGKLGRSFKTTQNQEGRGIRVRWVIDAVACRRLRKERRKKGLQ
jgi:hypothetical protein